MGEFNLYKRMREHGTLTETPQDVPDPTFALPSTVHWMRALAILVADRGVDFNSARESYRGVQRRDLADREINTVCEQLLFALNQLSALEAMAAAPNKADVARMAIVAWYYGIYASASAMVAANDGSFQDNHGATAQQWDRQLAGNRLVMEPFGDRISKLDAVTVDAELVAVRARGKYSLTATPSTPQQAWGCVAEYLSGTASWEQWNVRSRLVEHRDFKELRVDNFRTLPARKLRDSWYARRSISFLHQASRYRGKANYRDSIYLAYGRSVASIVDEFVSDLRTVLRGFATMSGAYVSVRMGADLWNRFFEDVEARRSFSLSPATVWS